MSYDVEILSSYLLDEFDVKSPKYRDYVANILSWLFVTPKYTIYRVNTLAITCEDVESKIRSEISQQAQARGVICPMVFIHPNLKDVIVVDSWKLNSLNLNPKLKEVIVDISCGAAVLRGSHIFAPGVKGMPGDGIPGDCVSVYVDIENKCTRGLTSTFLNKKYFVGNGTVRIGRNDLFGKNAITKGVAVEMKDTLRGVPCLSVNCIPASDALLQNLPSTLCGWILDPKPGDKVLDMCASPGNKTTHLATLMNDKGSIVALDKTTGKIQSIRDKCEAFGITCVQCYACDSTKIVSEAKESGDESSCAVPSAESKERGVTFPPESFDRVLLDAPCSALGQRPQLNFRVSVNQLKSYPPLQRKLFQSAVSLLRPGGHLVYSTCTVTLAENEQMIKWALDKFPCLSLVPIDETFGGPGLECVGLNELQRICVRRFGPPLDNIEEYCKTYDYNHDTVGFFIAHFIKNV